MKAVVNVGYYLRFFFLACLILALMSPKYGVAQSKTNTLLDSDPQSLARGIGHYERARSLLLAAIREFDSGYKYVKPDQVLDSDQWRKTLLTRAEELETVLSPRPREIKSGARYEPDSRLLGPKAVPEAELKK